MRLTTKGRFAVTAMIDLALRSNNGPVALAAISQRQQISLSYLEQLFGKLRRHDLVESTRGPGGGYSLGRRADEITVADIIVAVDEPLDATGCGGRRRGNRSGSHLDRGGAPRCADLETEMVLGRLRANLHALDIYLPLGLFLPPYPSSLCHT